MRRYRFHRLGLEVGPAELEARARLSRLWSDLSWHPCGDDEAPPAHCLSLELHEERRPLPSGLRHSFTAESFSGFDGGDSEFYLTDGDSLLHIRPAHLEAIACLAPSFFDKSLTLQYTFWSFAISRLMRPLGLFALHAAGLVHTAKDDGILVIGPSGSGKTTVTLDALGHGWRYVSDDAVLLCTDEGGTVVAAVGVRKHCYIDSGAASRHSAFELAGDVPDNTGGTRRRVRLGTDHARQRVNRCIPRLLLFPTIVNREQSVLRPLGRRPAFTALLDASCNQLWDRRTMPQHLGILKAVVAQAPAYELQAGRDVYRDPSLLVRWLDDYTNGVASCAS